MCPIEWKMVRVPKEVHAELMRLREKTKMPLWKLLNLSYTYWRTAYLSHFRGEKNILGKKVWYIYKLASSVGVFKEYPSDENFRKLMRTIYQIEHRLRIDMKPLRFAISNYKTRPTSKNKMVINDTCKAIIMEILTKE